MHCRLRHILGGTILGRVILLTVALVMAVGSMDPGNAQAQTDGPRLFRSKSSYDDVRFELNNAIIARGLNITALGNIGDMLDRTGPDIGATKKIYKAAEYLSFCSAKLSRQMMEADPANLAFCPFVIVIYEAIDKPGETVVAYRPLIFSGNDASKAAIAEADKLLEGIARDATK